MSRSPKLTSTAPRFVLPLFLIDPERIQLRLRELYSKRPAGPGFACVELGTTLRQTARRCPVFVETTQHDLARGLWTTRAACAQEVLLFAGALSRGSPEGESAPGVLRRLRIASVGLLPGRPKRVAVVQEDSHSHHVLARRSYTPIQGSR